MSKRKNSSRCFSSTSAFINELEAFFTCCFWRVLSCKAIRTNSPQILNYARTHHKTNTTLRTHARITNTTLRTHACTTKQTQHYARTHHKHFAKKLHEFAERDRAAPIYVAMPEHRVDVLGVLQVFQRQSKCVQHLLQLVCTKNKLINCSLQALDVSLSCPNSPLLHPLHPLLLLPHRG